MMARLQNRARHLYKLAKLKARWRLGRGSLVEDYGWVRLGFSNDGDLQELWYHINCMEWHANEVAALRRFVRPGATIVDVGANLGFTVAIFAELAGPAGRVLAFEPSLRTFAKLKRTIEINGLANVKAFDCGCGDSNSVESLVSPDASSGHRSLLIEPHAAHQSSEPVKLVRLDDMMRAEAAQVDLLKIDTEGYEPQVLRGAHDLLRRDRPVVYIELCDEYRRSSAQAIELLREAGYRFPIEPDLGRAANGANFIAVPVERNETN